MFFPRVRSEGHYSVFVGHFQSLSLSLSLSYFLRFEHTTNFLKMRQSIRRNESEPQLVSKISKPLLLANPPILFCNTFELSKEVLNNTGENIENANAKVAISSSCDYESLKEKIQKHLSLG